MFRSERGAVAAFRTEDDDGVCISELWFISSGGHAAPLPLPPEPDTDDFFQPGRPLPGRLSSSCTYCVFDKGLEVLPSFTSDGFPCAILPDNAVYYLWPDLHQEDKKHTLRRRTGNGHPVSLAPAARRPRPRLQRRSIKKGRPKPPPRVFPRMLTDLSATTSLFRYRCPDR